jgi:arylsulfatase A-like enzyme
MFRLIQGTILAAVLVALPGYAAPNVLLIFVDDLGQRDLAVYGSTYHETPNLDTFAESATLFTDGYASCPVCSPSRASIQTGKYPARVGITDWIPGAGGKGNVKLQTPQDLHQLPKSETTIAETLQANGYKTFYAGKWHLGGEGSLPTDHGYDINFAGNHTGGPRGGYYAPWANPQITGEQKPGEYLPDRLTSETIQFMEANKGGPFFAMLSFYTIHTPIQACKRHIKHYEEKKAALGPSPEARVEHRGKTNMRQDNAALASMVHAMDENVGRLLDALDRLKIADDTVVIFTSDNGALTTKATPGPGSALPLRAGKGWCYEGGVRVPFIVRAPGVSKPGSRSAAPVTSTDVYPTILDLCGIKAMPAQHPDGVSIVPALKTGELERDTIYWHYPHYHGSTWAPGAALRAGKWKLIEFYETGDVELYDLSNDLGEQQDLSKTNPEKKAELLARLHAWQKEVGAKMPTPNPNYDPNATPAKKKRKK